MNEADVTDLLMDWRKGDSSAFDQLFPLVYHKMKKLAGAQLANEHAVLTIQQTELVHEVFLKMVKQDKIEAIDRVHFYNIAVRCMRQILVDYARIKKAERRGGGNNDLTFDESLSRTELHADDILEIDFYLEELKVLDERMSKVVELRFFGGLSNQQIADTLNVSVKTVIRDWTNARAWLYSKMS